MDTGNGGESVGTWARPAREERGHMVSPTTAIPTSPRRERFKFADWWTAISSL